MFCPKCGTENPVTGKFCRSCGTDLGNVSAALSGELQKPQAVLLSQKGNPLTWEGAIVKLFSGLAFLGVSIALSFSQSGRGWWFWMLIPAFSILGTGVAQIVQLKKHEKNNALQSAVSQNTLQQTQVNEALPPSQQDFIKPSKSIYDTGELVERPPSVTEGTTKLLKIEESE
jgi:zinc-ribbon domain